jgi:thioredoxin 1
MIESVGSESLRSEVNNGGKAVVQFHATWCGPCKALAPHFEAAASEAGSISWIRADVDQLDPQTLSEYQIMSVPRVILFEDGKPVKDIMGRTKYSILEEVNG